MKKTNMEEGSVFEKILHEETLYEGTYLNLKKLEIELPNGNRGIREIVEVRNASAIFAVDDQQNVLLVRQSRPAIRKTALEIPAGLIDDGESEDDAVRRECEEETGYRPRKVRRLVKYAHAEGYSTGFITLYLGIGLEHTGNMKLDATEYVEPVLVALDEVIRLIRQNKITDSKTILGVALCERFVRKGCRDEGLLLV
ncbi:NUDIX hydrolase [bacterium]|nr:NUDIX hydrolase [bacterium]